MTIMVFIVIFFILRTKNVLKWELSNVYFHIIKSALSPSQYILYNTVMLDNLCSCPPICLLRPFSAAINLTFYIFFHQKKKYKSYFFSINTMHIYTWWWWWWICSCAPLLLSLHTRASHLQHIPAYDAQR